MNRDKKAEVSDLAKLLNGLRVDQRLADHINRRLDKTGIYYRSFSRVKSPDSLAEKLIRKNEKYIREGKKLQDIVGVRIVLYFEDDIPLCRKMVEEMFAVHEEDSEVDMPESSEFKPERMNLICTLPEEYVRCFPEKLWQNYRIDQTFELQIRTIFSEGWHEVEHDIRYKHEAEWNGGEYYEFDRELNGIKATLEICDRYILHMMDRLTYFCYDNNRVEEMLRYKFRIHFEVEHLSQPLLEMIDKELMKKLYKIQRKEVLLCFYHERFADIPKTLDNLVYVCNGMEIHNEKITSVTPKLIREYVEGYVKTQK